MGRAHKKKPKLARADRLEAARFARARAGGFKRAVLLQTARMFPNGWGWRFHDGSVVVMNPGALLVAQTWRAGVFRTEDEARAKLAAEGFALPAIPADAP